MKKIASLFLVILLMLVINGCGNTTDTSTTENTNQENTTNTENSTNGQETVVLDYYKVTDKTVNLNAAKDRYNLANKYALQWQADAVLLLVSTKFNNKLSDEGAVDRYLFSSNIRPDLYFAIDIARDNIDRYTRNLVYVEDYALKSGVMPIPLRYWKTTANEALEIADAQGGAQFRKDNPNYIVTQVLSLTGGKNLAWYIVYEAPGVNSFEIIIDTWSQTVIPN